MSKTAGGWMTMTLSLQDVLERIRAEYREMPGMALTRAQVERLCGVEVANCRLALELLVQSHFLSLSAGGMYVRVG
jgi:hypothetical protein